MLLLPVTMSVANRDDPRADWSDAQPQDISAPVYAGNIDASAGNIAYGDMVSWKIPGTDDWSDVSFAWSALAPDGVTTIDGPSGYGANEWRMADSDSTDPNGNTTLTWPPGNYTITCNVTFPDSSTVPLTFTQQVGWRTDNYLVIGQIVHDNYYNTDAPSLIAVGNEPWEVSSPTYEFREAVLHDMADIFTPIDSFTTDTAIDALSVAPVPITQLMVYPWSAYWSFGLPHSLTPQGPFTSSYLGSGNVTQDERNWMMQTVLNSSVDAPNAPSTIDYGTALTKYIHAGQFRVLQNYQMKFLLNDDGTFGAVTPVQNVSKIGLTKASVLTLPAGLFKFIGWNNPEIELGFPAETNEYNGQMTTSSDGTQQSGYATGRVGEEGRNMIWRLWGKDAPWIFSETIFTLDPDNVLDASINTSVDMSWANGVTTSGSHPFNNLNIYKLKYDSESDTYFFNLQSTLPMSGQLQSFFDGGSSTWTEVGGGGIPPSLE